MDKWQALNSFWNSFGIQAYDNSSVPDDAGFPRFTYDAATGRISDSLFLSGSLWYKDSSWAAISQKAEQIQAYLQDGFTPIKLDGGGYLVICPGVPFAQRMSNPDDTIRRIYINLQAEFVTAK